MTILHTEFDKDRLHKRLVFLLRRTLDFVDDSDSIWRHIQRQRKINEMADKLAAFIKDAHCDEEDAQDAIERALQKVF